MPSPDESVIEVGRADVHRGSTDVGMTAIGDKPGPDARAIVRAARRDRDAAGSVVAGIEAGLSAGRGRGRSTLEPPERPRRCRSDPRVQRPLAVARRSAKNAGGVAVQAAVDLGVVADSTRSSPRPADHWEHADRDRNSEGGGVGRGIEHGDEPRDANQAPGYRVGRVRVPSTAELPLHVVAPAADLARRDRAGVIVTRGDGGGGEPVTATGDVRRSTVPSPSWPDALRPQQRTLPVSRSAQACLAPPASATTCDKPATAAGTGCRRASRCRPGRSRRDPSRRPRASPAARTRSDRGR